MTADIQTLNFITNKLERLPLGDALVSENLPKLFCWRGINGLDEMYPHGLKPGLVTSPTSSLRSKTPSKLADWRYEGENVQSLLKRARVECQETFCFTAQNNPDFVLSKFLPQKKKRPSEETNHENSSVVIDDDEEVSLICRTEAESGRHLEFECQSRPAFSNVHERSLFKPVARRPRSRPSVGLAEMKAKSSWRGSPHKTINDGQNHREVKLVKVPQYTTAAEETLSVLRKDYCFRPIVRSGVFEALDDHIA